MIIDQLPTIANVQNSDELPIERGQTTYKTTVGAVIGAVSKIVADDYDNSSTYAVGDYCIYEGTLYVCNTDISTAEEWNATHWTATNVTDEIPSAYTSNPAMDGTASPGSTGQWADGGHVHPTDTSRAAADLGISGATTNQYVQITAVDGNGKPTAFGAGTPSGGGGTNRNFLDNWFFRYGSAINNDYNRNGTFPVNQRGQQSYSTANAYSFDRWKLTSGSVSVGQYGITLNGTIVQILENAIGQAVVCSALLSDGTMITPTYDDSTKTFTLTATGQTIVAVKLEIGDTQTLAHQENGVWVLNEIPNYNDELIKCRQYFIPIFGAFLVSEIATNNLYFKISIWPLQYLKRADPTVTWPNRSSSTTITNRNNALATGFTFGSVYYASAASTINVRYDKTSHGLSNAVLNIPATEPIFISYDL